MNDRRDALVGVVILAALVVITLGTLWLQGVMVPGERVDVEAAFSDVGMIQPGAGVKFRGVQIGRIRTVEVDESGEFVRVVMRIDAEVRLPDDAVVVLSPESMFGDWQAEIQAPGRFSEARFTRIDEEGVLPGYALPDISELTAAADEISDNLASLTERVGIAFSEETAQNIASLVANVEEVTTRLADLVDQQATSFTEVTDGVQAAVDEIGGAASQAQRSFAGIDSLLVRGNVETSLMNLGTISSNLAALTGELDDTNEDIRNLVLQVDSTFARVDRVMTEVEEGDGSLARLLRDPTLAGELEAAAAELTLLLEDIRENPRRYLRLSIF